MTERTDVEIRLEFTPNPNTLKFVVNRQLLERGAANFPTSSTADRAPLARKLFGVPGVESVMIGTNFVTITKANDGEWDTVAEKVPLTIESHFQTEDPVVDPAFLAEASSPSGSADESDAVKRIREVLDNEIRPAVAMDGGDITFDRYDDGVVYLHLQGACSSCPSSVATLKMGVESRLKEVVPEIKEVVQV